MIERVWDGVTGTQPALGAGALALTAVVAAAIVLVTPLWRIGRHVVTIAHEGAHGVAALLSGRRLSGIRLHSDTSGLTVSRGKPRGPGMVVTAFAGYVGPSLIGLGAAYLLSLHHAVAVLWSALLLLALLLFQIRNFFGLWAVLVAGIGVGVVSWWGTGHQQSLVAYAGTWFLLIAGPRPVLELQQLRRRGRARDSDADVLARLTRIPGLVWIGVYLVITIGCLAIGGRWLLAA